MSATTPRRQFCILVVDDEAVVVSAVGRALRRRGDQVLVAPSLDEARQLLQRPGCQVDHALIDLTLPDGDGLSFAVELHLRYPHIRITLTTGGNVPMVTDFGILLKPFTIYELWAAIA